MGPVRTAGFHQRYHRSGAGQPGLIACSGRDLLLQRRRVHVGQTGSERAPGHTGKVIEHAGQYHAQPLASMSQKKSPGMHAGGHLAKKSWHSLWPVCGVGFYPVSTDNLVKSDF